MSFKIAYQIGRKGKTFEQPDGSFYKLGMYKIGDLTTAVTEFFPKGEWFFDINGIRRSFSIFYDLNSSYDYIPDVLLSLVDDDYQKINCYNLKDSTSIGNISEWTEYYVGESDYSFYFKLDGDFVYIYGERGNQIDVENERVLAKVFFSQFLDFLYNFLYDLATYFPSIRNSVSFKDYASKLSYLESKLVELGILA